MKNFMGMLKSAEKDMQNKYKKKNKLREILEDFDSNYWLNDDYIAQEKCMNKTIRKIKRWAKKEVEKYIVFKARGGGYFKK